VYLDECGFSPSQPVSYSWTLAGQRKYISYENPQGRRINALAALVHTADAESLIWMTRPRTFRADDLVFFLNEALPCSTKLRVVVLDNASLHRNRVVRAARRALREQGIVLYYLPPYSPDLNAIEPYFGVVKHHEMPARTYRTLPELDDAIDHAFASVEARLITKQAQELCPCA